MYFHYITMTATVFCPPFGPYLRKCLCNLAESWLLGMAMRYLIRNIQTIRGVSITYFCVYVFSLHCHKATVFCPPFGPYLRNCLCDWAESWLVGTAMRWLIRNTHIIKGVSIHILRFIIFCYIPITASAF